MLTKEEIEQAFKGSMSMLREGWKEKEEKERNPPECPDTCELKQELLETPEEEFNRENLLLKYEAYANYSPHHKIKHLLQDLNIRDKAIYVIKKEMELLQNLLQEVYANSKEE